MLMLSKVLDQNINKLVWKYLQYVRCRLQHGTSTQFSFSGFFLNTTNTWECLLIIFFFSFFFWLQCVNKSINNLLSLFVCFFKNSDALYFFPADWLLSIVIDKLVMRSSYGYCFRRFGKLPQQYLRWSFQ